MSLYTTVSTVRGILILFTLGTIAVGLIWWQGELTKIEEETHAAYAGMWAD